MPSTLLHRLAGHLGSAVSATQLFAYTYGLLSATAYADTFAEELTLPPLRLPITADAALFAEVAAAGSKLLWLHTYGERYVPVGQVPGRVPPGRAKSIKGIGTALGGGPETFDWVADPVDAEVGVLHVGEGRVGPVSRAVWAFSVSGYEVLKSWLAFRMKVRSGRKSSVLDDIRPDCWDATLSQELREVIWVLEATVDAQPHLHALFQRVVSGPVIRSDQLPQPSAAECLPPGDDDAAPVQQPLI